MFKKINRRVRELKETLMNLFEVNGLCLISLDDAVQKKLRRQQIRGTIKQQRPIYALLPLFAPAMMSLGWNQGINYWLIIWGAFLFAICLSQYIRYARLYETKGSVRDMQELFATQVLDALTWSAALILMYPLIDGMEKTILVTVLVAHMTFGISTMSQTPLVALGYLSVICPMLITVPILHGISVSNSFDILLGVLSLVGGMAVVSSIVNQSRDRFEAFVNLESLSQRSEVIDLLLKTHDATGVETGWSTDASSRLITCPKPILELMPSRDQNFFDLDLITFLDKNMVDPSSPDLKKVRYALERKAGFSGLTLPFKVAGTEEIRWIVISGQPKYQNSLFIGYSGNFSDVTSTLEAQKQADFLAKMDPLTGLYNRSFLQKTLADLVKGIDFASAYLIDLDGFKQINDRYGHPVGDELLCDVAKRMRKIASSGDVIARLGGDEFLFLSQHQDARLGAGSQFAASLLSKLSEPYNICGLEAEISASIGIARFPEDTQHGMQLLNLADLALYSAKNAGKNRCVDYSNNMLARQKHRTQVTEKLRDAVHGKQIRPFFQPQICTLTGQIIAVEVLARWRDSELGPIPPDIFIPVAEETGLINEMSQSLFEEACAAALNWPDLPDKPPIELSLNLSPAQITRGTPYKLITNVLEKTGFPPERLVIEITETVLIDDIEQTRNTLKAVSDLGIKLALDDFGTGYSSLNYIRALPLHQLKIDKSFVADLNDPGTAAIVRSVIRLGHDLDLKIVAEGVENEAQARKLISWGCDLLQGYRYYRPMPISQITPIIEQQKIAVA